MVGALGGGWLADRVGRWLIFLATILSVVVFALAQAFVPGVAALAIVRMLLGVPLGSDIANGYSYIMIMEVLPRGEHEVVGNRWQLMFALGGLLGPGTVALLLLAGLPHPLIWRVTRGLGALPATALFGLWLGLPETAIWLVRRGRFREAKAVARRLCNDPLDMLPDHDVAVAPARPLAFLGAIGRDRLRRHATLFGWIACFAQGSELSRLGFYLPVLFVLVGVAGPLGTELVLLGLSLLTIGAGWSGPRLLPRLGQRRLSIAGFGIVLAALLVAAWALASGHISVLIAAAGAMMWGHNWDTQNCMTIPSMVAPPEHRGVATGFAYVFVKLPSFAAIFLFPVLFAAIGPVRSTLVAAVFPLLGLAAAVFVLPEVFGFGADAAPTIAAAQPGYSVAPPSTRST